MNSNEWTMFCRDMCVQFPGLDEFVLTKSPDPKATFRLWFECLEDVTYDEASSVLRDWRIGTIPPLKFYERDLIATTIRAYVHGTRARNRQRELNEERRREIEERKQTRIALAGIGVDTAYLLSRVEIQKRERGEISKEEERVNLQKILSMVG